MTVSHAMTAAHLMKFQVKYDYGVPYHYTIADKVQELVDLVKKTAVPLDYDLPTCGTAFLRLNYIIKDSPNKESWMFGGGALISPDVNEHVTHLVNKLTQDGKVVKNTNLTAYILNEWERFNVVFELAINLEVSK